MDDAFDNFEPLGPRRVIYNLAAVEAWAKARTFPHRAAELTREV
jgi:hypothetical protein